MKKLIVALVIASLPLLAQAQDWSKVALLDKKCHDAGEDEKVDSHTRQCLLHCAEGGFGIIDADGKWIPLDAAGSKLALAAVKKTKKADHIRVNVSGEVKNDAIAVSKLAIVD